MRILLNTKPMVFSNKTGVGYFVANLYRELRKTGIVVIPTLDDKSITIVDSLSKLSAPLRSLMGKTYPFFAKIFGGALVNHLLKKETPAVSYDLYHETSIEPMPEISARTVCNLYDLSIIHFPEFFTKDFAEKTAWSVRRNLALADRIIVNTQFIKDDAISLMGLPDEKIDVVPLASSGAYYRLDRQATMPTEVKRFTEKPYVLYVGTVEPRKNLKTLIKAFTKVREGYDLALVIAGGLGWLYEDVLSYPDKFGVQRDVIFTSYVDEKTLLYLYNYASVFVYPSFYEGFGIPPLEAMSCGVPVIISDIPPLKEVAGKAALTFKPNDHEELAQRIDMVLCSEALRRELGEKGVGKAREYSWQKVVEGIVKTYIRILEN